VTCGRCAQPVDVREATSISASRAPLWRDALLDGTLHRPTCGGCGAVLDVQVRFLYTDLPRGQWLVVEPPAALPRWRACEREALATFDRLAAAAPAIITDVLARCRVRVVFGVDELRERVRADACELDDAMLECVKLVVLRRQPDVRDAGERLRFERFGIEELELVAAPAASPADVRKRWQIPRATVDELVPARWRSEFPELFARGFVSIDRWLADEDATGDDQAR
jgi:hypothetical protein